MYGIELIGFDEANFEKVIKTGDFSLYAVAGNHVEAPGISLVALSNDWPAEPQWDWEEFQSWSPDKQASVFGSFYDQKYRDLSISNASTCPITVESFDGRESAQDAAYGRWLHNLPSDVIGIAPKGIVVGAPIASCEQRAKLPAGDIEQITVIVDSAGAEKAQQVEVRFRVYLVEERLHWNF